MKQHTVGLTAIIRRMSHAVGPPVVGPSPVHKASSGFQSLLRKWVACAVRRLRAHSCAIVHSRARGAKGVAGKEMKTDKLWRHLDLSFVLIAVITGSVSFLGGCGLCLAPRTFPPSLLSSSTSRQAAITTLPVLIILFARRQAEPGPICPCFSARVPVTSPPLEHREQLLPYWTASGPIRKKSRLKTSLGPNYRPAKSPCVI